MKRVDRYWWKDAEDDALATTKAKQAIDRSIEDRIRGAKRKQKLEKRLASSRSKGAGTIAKMFPVSYWAETLGFDEDTIREWCRQNIVFNHFIRGQYRISEDAMNEFLAREDKKRAV